MKGEGLFNHKMYLGTIAWIFHRISGIALIFYLVIHVWVVHHLSYGPESFDKIMAFLSSPLFKLSEVALLAAILYHSINGIRLIIVEFPLGNKYQKELFLISFGISSLLTLLGGYFLLKPLL